MPVQAQSVLYAQQTAGDNSQGTGRRNGDNEGRCRALTGQPGKIAGQPGSATPSPLSPNPNQPSKSTDAPLGAGAQLTPICAQRAWLRSMGHNGPDRVRAQRPDDN
jgi:hypothetical protein